MKFFFENREQPFTFFSSASIDFDPHLHEHLEMIYLVRGTCNVTVEGKTYHLKAGELSIVFPNQIHSYSDSKDIVAYIMIFSPSIMPEFRQTLLSYVPRSPIIPSGRDITRLIEIIFESLCRPTEFYKGILWALFSCVLEVSELEKYDSCSMDTLKRVLMYIDGHFSEAISIESVSNELHISRSHISHIFRKKLNTTFIKYLTSKRVDYATELLKVKDISVTEAALNSGFGSIRSFNRVFTEYTGTSPRSFRAEAAKEKVASIKACFEIAL